MAVCAITGKRTRVGNSVSHANNRTKRWLKCNLQRVKVVLPNGQIKRVYVSTKALKAGKVSKAPNRKHILARLSK